MTAKRILFLTTAVVLALVAITSAATALTITSISPTSAFRGQTITATVTGTGFLTNAQVWVRSPTTGYRGSTVTAYVAGTGFMTGCQVRLTGGGTTIDATSETAISSTQIKCTVAIPSTAYVGYYTVSVQNPRTGVWSSKANAFRILRLRDYS